jgi:hypothetical protein
MSLQSSNHRADPTPYLRQNRTTLARLILAVDRALLPSTSKRVFAIIRKGVTSGAYPKSCRATRMGQNFSEHPGHKPLNGYFRAPDAETETSTDAGNRHFVLLQTTLGRARESDQLSRLFRERAECIRRTLT